MKRPTKIIEIVGPAGAGKTTLTARLAESAPALQVGLRLCSWRFMPLFGLSALMSLPAILGEARKGSAFTFQEIRLIVYLQVQLWIVLQHAAQRVGVLVLDQGPIYKLAELSGFDLQRHQGRAFQHWWTRMVDQWAGLLDLVVYLDASDAVLMQRIKTRAKSHTVKQLSTAEAAVYLARYRAAVQAIIAQMAGNGSPAQMRFSTDQNGTVQIVHRVLAALSVPAPSGSAASMSSGSRGTVYSSLTHGRAQIR